MRAFRSIRPMSLRVHAGILHLLNHEPDADSGPATLDPVGGQAVVEGVLMRSRDRIAVAARAPDGTIALHSREFTPFSRRHRLLALPVLRGAASLVEALYVGSKALSWSAAVQERSGREAEELGPPSSFKEKALMVATLAGSLAVALGLFQLLPYATAALITGGSRENPANPLLFNTVAGSVRIALLIAYMRALAFLPDVRRLFEYHGAEHKSIFAHEGGAGLEPGSVAAQSRFHPRCGTSFILIVALTCILFFSLFDALLLHGIGYAYPNFFVRFLFHLPFIPAVAGLSFELLKLSARNQDAAWVRALTRPGLWLQRITTREPDAAQIEVAIASAKAAVAS